MKALYKSGCFFYYYLPAPLSLVSLKKCLLKNLNSISMKLWKDSSADTLPCAPSSFLTSQSNPSSSSPRRLIDACDCFLVHLPQGGHVADLVRHLPLRNSKGFGTLPQCWESHYASSCQLLQSGSSSHWATWRKTKLHIEKEDHNTHGPCFKCTHAKVPHLLIQWWLNNWLFSE